MKSTAGSNRADYKLDIKLRGILGASPVGSIRPARYFDGVSLKIFPSFMMTARIFARSSGHLIFALSPALIRRRRKWQFMLPRVPVSVSQLRYFRRHYFRVRFTRS